MVQGENMSEITAKMPWKDYVGEVPLYLDYFDGSMFEAVAKIAEAYPNNIAFDFMGKSTRIKSGGRALSLKTIGVRENDKVTIAMPNCPQAIYMFYAVNLIGGIANMIHPLRREGDRVLPQRVRKRHGHHAGSVLQQV